MFIFALFFPIRWLWQSSPGAKTGGLSWDFDVNCKDHRDTPQQFTTLWQTFQQNNTFNYSGQSKLLSSEKRQHSLLAFRHTVSALPLHYIWHICSTIKKKTRVTRASTAGKNFKTLLCTKLWQWPSQDQALYKHF